MSAISVNYSIRHLEASDTQRAHQLSKKMGWSSTQQEWANDIDFAAKTSFAVLCEGMMIGVGMGLLYGAKARLARIIIDPDHQGKGLGKKLIERLITSVQQAGASWIELDATEEGKHLYTKLGFQFQETIVTLVKTIENVASIVLNQPCRAGQKADLDQIEALDSKAFGTSRRFYLDRTLNQQKVFVVEQEGKLTGFLLCVRGENGVRIGAWRSENKADAERLLKTAVIFCQGQKQTIHIPKNHSFALTLAQSVGFKVSYESDKMCLGESPPNTNPDLNLALWSLALG